MQLQQLEPIEHVCADYQPRNVSVVNSFARNSKPKGREGGKI